jgi:hypothetical protein
MSDEEKLEQLVEGGWVDYCIQPREAAHTENRSHF